MTHTIPYGTSEPQDFELQDNGEAIDGTGFAVGIEILTHTGEDVGTEPTVAWLSQADGTVRVSGVENLAVGTYKVRFTLTDGSGKVGYVPNGLVADTWKVVVRQTGS